MNEFNNCDRIMELRIFVNDNSSFSVANSDLYNMYCHAAMNHNEKMNQSLFPDAGFDLFTPENMICTSNIVNKINFLVRTSARMICENGKVYNTGFYMHPRSSLSGTPLRLANSTGIIDSGYRGDLIGKFDCINNSGGNNNYNNNYIINNIYGYSEYTVNKFDKLMQIVAPGMVPIHVKVVSSLEELGDITERGDGGFGSTGR